MKKIFFLLTLPLFLTSCFEPACPNCLADPNAFYERNPVPNIFYSLRDAMTEKIKADEQRRENTFNCFTPDGRNITCYPQ
jgi:hypothetical protein